MSGERAMVLRVCECGSVASVDAPALTRCGRDSRGNMKYSCPVRRVRVTAWEDDQSPVWVTGSMSDPRESA